MKWQWPALLFFLCLNPLFSIAQTPLLDQSVISSDQLQVLRTVRGDIFFGDTRLLNNDSVIFVTQQQLELRYAVDQVEWLGFVKHAEWLKNQLEAVSAADGWTMDLEMHGHENLSYSATAFAYPKGVGEYRNIDLLYNTVDIGVGEHFSLGGGTVIPFILTARAKLAFDLDNTVHLGLGMNTLVAYGPDLGGVASHFFGIVTLGTPQHFLNFTAGPAVDWGYPEENPFIVTVGGGISLGKRWRIYGDVGFDPNYEGFVPTFLFSWRNRFNRWDFGLLNIPDDFTVAIPLLSYTRRF